MGNSTGSEVRGKSKIVIGSSVLSGKYEGCTAVCDRCSLPHLPTAARVFGDILQTCIASHAAQNGHRVCGLPACRLWVTSDHKVSYCCTS